MSLATGSIRKNGKMLLDNVRLWVNHEEGATGPGSYWGYFNPEWEAPIGRLDPDGEADAEYELDLGREGRVPVHMEDHRDEAFIQINQNGYRTVHFESTQ